MALLFDATLGLFSGWVRALAGMALASLATVIATAAGLALVESELPSLKEAAFAGFGHPVDPQEVTTIVAVVALVTLVSSLAAMRMTSAFVLRRPALGRASDAASPRARRAGEPMPPPSQAIPATRSEPPSARPRGATVADALAAAVRREQAALILASGPARSPDIRSPGGGPYGPAFADGGGLGAAGRRNFHRRTRVAARRDNSR
jgi:type IV secretion system protein VirB6